MHWLRLYTEVVEDPKVQALSGVYFKLWINCLCLARLNEGVLPSTRDIAWKLRRPESEISSGLSKLSAIGLLDKTDSGLMPHNWRGRQYNSDCSTARVKRFRMKRPCNGDETVDETACNDQEGVSCNNSASVSVSDSVSSSVSEKQKTSSTALQVSGPKLFDLYWEMFVRTGITLSTQDQYEAFKLFDEYPETEQKKIVAHAAYSIRHVWSGPKFTPKPVGHLRKMGWTGKASPRTIGRAREPTEAEKRAAETQRIAMERYDEHGNHRSQH